MYVRVRWAGGLDSNVNGWIAKRLPTDERKHPTESSPDESNSALAAQDDISRSTRVQQQLSRVDANKTELAGQQEIGSECRASSPTGSLETRAHTL